MRGGRGRQTEIRHKQSAYRAAENSRTRVAIAGHRILGLAGGADEPAARRSRRRRPAAAAAAACSGVPIPNPTATGTSV